jgi:hypothetical protein
VFTPAAPSQPQTSNEENEQGRTWVQIVNATSKTNNATHLESAIDELRRINPAYAEERHSTCQHVGCEFEETHEEVRTHEESCDRRRNTEKTPAEESDTMPAQDAA